MCSSDLELLAHEGVEVRDRYGIRDIHLEGTSVASLGGNRSSGCFRLDLIYVNQDYARTFRAEAVCNGTADARARSGDYRYHSLEFQVFPI